MRRVSGDKFISGEATARVSVSRAKVGQHNKLTCPALTRTFKDAFMFSPFSYLADNGEASEACPWFDWDLPKFGHNLLYGYGGFRCA